MARSFSRSLASAAMRALREAERERKRTIKAQQRAYEKQVREQTKARQKLEKERYIESMMLEAVNQSERLIKEMNKYSDIATEAMNNVKLVEFEGYRTLFMPNEFSFSEPVPINLPPKLQEVPKESWLDNIFSARIVKRRNIIESNEEMVRRAKEDYEQKLEDYNLLKKQKYDDWSAEEERRKGEVLQKNQEVDKWQEDFYSCGEDAVLKFIEAAFDKNWLFSDTITEIESGYNEHTKKAIIEIHVKNKNDIFPYEGYKYFKTRDSIEPVKMKVTPSNQRIKDLMLNIAIAMLHITFRNANAEKDIVNEIVVNVFHEGVCCISGDVVAEQFIKLDLNITSHYDALLDNYFRVANQLARGVKSFERIYVQLGLE